MKIFEFNRSINAGGTFRFQTNLSDDIEIVRTRNEDEIVENVEGGRGVFDTEYEAGSDELLATIPKSKIPALVEWLKEVE